jgi:hypothetical protein
MFLLEADDIAELYFYNHTFHLRTRL